MPDTGNTLNVTQFFDFPSDYFRRDVQSQTFTLRIEAFVWKGTQTFISKKKTKNNKERYLFLPY